MSLSKSARKLRRLRGRAYAMVILLVAGGAYCGGQLAMAHSRPAQVPDVSELPESIVCSHKDLRDWIPGTGVTVLPDTQYVFKADLRADTARDPLSDPQLHALEESCNQNGIYPSSQEGGLEFQLQIGDVLYSSLDGVQSTEAPSATGPDYSSKDLQKWGWSGDLPLWAMVKPATVSKMLPAGVAWSDQVQALETKFWPEEKRGQIVVHMDGQFSPPSTDSSSLDLAAVWKQLPAGKSMMCLRKELLGSLWNRDPQVSSNHLAQRVLASADHWVGLSCNAEVDPGGLQKTWELMGRGWIPMALWSDFSVQQIRSSQHFEMQSNEFGTLFSLGVNPTQGTAGAPWERWADEAATDWLGAGHFEVSQVDGRNRVEWVARCQGSHLTVDFHWSAAPPLVVHQEVETMGPDLETLYTPHPNVIAGR